VDEIAQPIQWQLQLILDTAHKTLKGTSKTSTYRHVLQQLFAWNNNANKKETNFRSQFVSFSNNCLVCRFKVSVLLLQVAERFLELISFTRTITLYRSIMQLEVTDDSKPSAFYSTFVHTEIHSEYSEKQNAQNSNISSLSIAAIQQIERAIRYDYRTPTRTTLIHYKTTRPIGGQGS
jgi:hypothetical protein